MALWPGASLTGGYVGLRPRTPPHLARRKPPEALACLDRVAWAVCRCDNRLALWQDSHHPLWSKPRGPSFDVDRQTLCNKSKHALIGKSNASIHAFINLALALTRS